MTYTEPLIPIVLVLLSLELWRRVRWSRRGKGERPVFLAMAVAALFLISWQPVAWLVSRPLELPYSHRIFPEGDAQAIVVLSSSVLPPFRGSISLLPGEETYVRSEYAVWLYKNWRPLPVLACGGRLGTSEPFAVPMRHVIETEGVPASMIWTEERSHSTYENALYGAQILRNKGISRIVLVTDAYHMRRAGLCFRKQGIFVIPAPCKFYLFKPEFSFFLPGLNAIRWNERSLHEILGLIWYRMRGWI